MIGRIVALVTIAGFLGACGGPPNLTCDKVQPYQQVTPHKKIEAPEDLDDLDPLREVPVPEASPRPSRPAGSPCIDLPPGATSMVDAANEREAAEEQEDSEDSAEDAGNQE